MFQNIRKHIPNILWNLLVAIYYLPLKISRYLFHPLKPKEKIVFCNFNGRGYGENPQFIADEILRRGLNYDLVWLVKDTNTYMPEGIRKVAFDTIRAAYELATAKVVVNNVKNALPYIKKKEQYYIQAWHGELAMKLIEGECVSTLSPKYVKESIGDSKITDVLISGCKIDTVVYSKYFWYDGEIMDIGNPRYDVYFRDNEAANIQTKKRLGIDSQAKIVMYAPTFRDNGRTDVYNLDVAGILQALETATGDRWIFIVRMHPNVKSDSTTIAFNDRVIDCSKDPNPQYLVLISDLLITDYSSILVDFITIKKPVLLYTPDIEEYERERGLRPIYHEFPFCRANNNTELIDSIRELNMATYINNIIRFTDISVKSFDDGHASERIVDRIQGVMDNEKFAGGRTCS